MGNRRYCGFIQFVERTEITAKDGNEYTEKTLSVDVSSDFEKTGNPYYSYGFPASLYDAPCCNLGNCDKLIWRAYTFLTDMPSRMNENCLSFLMGFSWGYVEDGKGVCGLLDFEILPKTEWKRFCNFLSEKYPELKIENG